MTPIEDVTNMLARRIYAVAQMRVSKRIQASGSTIKEQLKLFGQAGLEQRYKDEAREVIAQLVPSALEPEPFNPDED